MKIDHDHLQLEAQNDARRLLTMQDAHVLTLAVQMRQAAALERIAYVLEDAAKIGGALSRS